MYDKILAPVDGSPRSFEALKEAIRLATALGAPVHLTVLHVAPTITANELSAGINVEELRQQQGKAVLKSAEGSFEGVLVEHDLRFLEGDPAQVICQFAKTERFDLIVLGNRGHGLFVELLMGSVSAKVVQHAPCPVLIVRQ